MGSSRTLELRHLRRSVGDNIRRLRGRQKMTLDKLSRRTGISSHKLDCFEMGKYDIGLRELLVIAVALNVEVGRLF